MDNHVVIWIKEKSGFLYNIQLIRYKRHLEISRHSFCVFNKEVEDSKPVQLDEFANLIRDMTVISFGQLSLLQNLFIGYTKELSINHIDCCELLGNVLPFVKGYKPERILELFRLSEIIPDGEYKDCLCIQQLFVASVAFSRGKFLHEVFPASIYFLSGYWQKKAAPDYAIKSSLFFGKKTVIAGEFKMLERGTIENMVEDSGGVPQGYPDDNTSLVIAGNMEFAAEYQTRPVHEALIRIRQSQLIRFISELELLSLLYNQITWVKEVAAWYRTVSFRPVPAKVMLAVSVKQDR